jgi:hypothetical protein
LAVGGVWRRSHGKLRKTRIEDDPIMPRKPDVIAALGLAVR